MDFSSFVERKRAMQAPPRFVSYEKYRNIAKLCLIVHMTTHGVVEQVMEYVGEVRLKRGQNLPRHLLSQQVSAILTEGRKSNSPIFRNDDGSLLGDKTKRSSSKELEAAGSGGVARTSVEEMVQQPGVHSTSGTAGQKELDSSVEGSSLFVGGKLGHGNQAKDVRQHVREQQERTAHARQSRRGLDSGKEGEMSNPGKEMQGNELPVRGAGEMLSEADVAEKLIGKVDHVHALFPPRSRHAVSSRRIVRVLSVACGHGIREDMSTH